MGEHRYLKRARRVVRPKTVLLRPGPVGLHTLLNRYVVKRFYRLCNETVVVVPLSLAEPEDTDTPRDNPGHPACAQYVGSDYCRESWQLHLAAVRRQPEAHWHTCEFGMLCGLVPVVYEQHCLAAIRLACPNSMSPAKFDIHLEFLSILVENFVAAETDFLRKCRDLDDKRPVLHVINLPAKPTDPSPHLPPPQISQAIQYIERHLADPSLSVSRVASVLELHPNYLSHFFTTHTGQRMSRFIVQRRMECAMNLLTTTDWPIKRIAHSTGYAHPNWFSHIFIEHVGCSPTAYRTGRRATG